MHDAAGSQTSNSNNSANLKPNLKKNLDTNQGPRWILLMKKTRAVKSRAIVPYVTESATCINVLVKVGTPAVNSQGISVVFEAKNSNICS